MAGTLTQILIAIGWLCFLKSATSNDVTNLVDDVIVTFDKGQQLRGVKTRWVTGESVNRFYGIPYALPPTGARRFEPPVPALDWSGVKDARVPGVICPQTLKEESQWSQSEDCLTLSVFTPDINASLPVMVWIHGGGYKTGSQYIDGDIATLTRYGIVTASINYRLSPFGFLSTEDEVMPGNYGMLDQVLALKWVQTNIHAFGGDPNQVTIAGESAGAFSVSLHCVSPLSKGLFHRAIMESGSSFAIGAILRPATLYSINDFTKDLATSVGCPKTNSSVVLQCLKYVDAQRLLLAADATEKKLGSTSPRPRVETVLDFLPDYPQNLIATGKYSEIDILVGFNSGERSALIQDTEDNGISKEEFSKQIDSFLYYIKDDALRRNIEQTYIGNETDPIKLRAILVSALADLAFGAPSLVELIKTIDQPGTRHYFYEFEYFPSNRSRPDWMQTVHAEERQFVFFDPNWTSRSDSDKTVGQRVQTMWTNFIRYGDPTPSSANSSDGSDVVRWSKFSKTNLETLQIRLQSTIGKFPRPFIFSLYEQLFKKVHEVFVSDILVG